MAKEPMDDVRVGELLRHVAVGNDAGKEAAVELLYNEFRPRLLSYFFRCLRDSEKAKDLFQAVMLKIFLRAGQHNAGSASGWIRKIAENEMKDLLRKAEPLEPLPEDEASLPECPPLGWDHWRRAQDADSARTRHAVDDCVSRQLQAFEKAHPRRGYALRMAVLEEWSIDQLAAFLGRTKGATREFISQSRKKLDGFMDECWALQTEGTA